MELTVINHRKGGNWTDCWQEPAPNWTVDWTQYRRRRTEGKHIPVPAPHCGAWSAPSSYYAFVSQRCRSSQSRALWGATYVVWRAPSKNPADASNEMEWRQRQGLWLVRSECLSASLGNSEEQMRRIGFFIHSFPVRGPSQPWLVQCSNRQTTSTNVLVRVLRFGVQHLVFNINQPLFTVWFKENQRFWHEPVLPRNNTKTQPWPSSVLTLNCRATCSVD